MNLINQYLYKNCTKTSLAVFLVLLLILLANTGLRLVEDINDGDVPSLFLIELLLLKMVQYSSLIIPLSLFFGIIVSLNRLYISNEMIIIKLNGFSNHEIAKLLSKLIFSVTFLMIILNFYISPLAVEHRSKIEHQIQHEQNIYSLKEGDFNISSDKSKVVYINDKDNSHTANIFIKSNSNDSHRIDIASGAEADDDSSEQIRLDRGVSYVFNLDGSFSFTEYITQDMLLINNLPEFITSDIETKSILELFHISNLSAHSEIFNRLSIILSTFILAYLAIPLSNFSKKNDKYKNVFIATFVYFSYIILINLLSSSANSSVQLLLFGFILHLLYLYLTYLLYKHTMRTVG